jgi:hypothetical protein
MATCPVAKAMARTEEYDPFEQGHVIELPMEWLPIREGNRDKCRFNGMHIHNGKERQAVHLHMQCDQLVPEDLDMLAEFIATIQVTGKSICTGRNPGEIASEQRKDNEEEPEIREQVESVDLMKGMGLR